MIPLRGNMIRDFFMFSFSTDVSLAYVTTGLSH